MPILKGTGGPMVYQTSIRIGSDTKDRLAELGNKGDSYEDIINALVDYFELTAKVHDKIKTRKVQN
jgi:hypothetical protein